jgi:hypothetical protein
VIIFAALGECCDTSAVRDDFDLSEPKFSGLT